MVKVPGEEFRFDLPYYTNKIGELSILLEQAERKRMILFGAYMELKNKYEPEEKQPQVELDMKDSVPVEEVYYGTEPPTEEVLSATKGVEKPKIVKRRSR